MAGEPALQAIIDVAREYVTRQPVSPAASPASARKAAAAGDADAVSRPGKGSAAGRGPAAKQAASQQLQQQQGKKAAMRPASDVIRRVLWDPEIPREHIIVGYDDRFVGTIEKPFNAFNWADFVTLSHTETAIPQHRIVHFKVC